MFKTKIIRMVAAVFAVAFMVAAVTGCKNNAADAAYGHYSGIVGTWERFSLGWGNYSKTYTFNADGSFSTDDTFYSEYKFWKSENINGFYVIKFSEDGNNWRTFMSGIESGHVYSYDWTFHDGSVYHITEKLTKQ